MSAQDRTHWSKGHHNTGEWLMSDNSPPEAHRALRPQSRLEGLLPSPAPYHGHTTTQCRCETGYHPEPSGTHSNQNHPKVLQSLQPQGAKGLLSSHGSGHAENGRTISLYLTCTAKLNIILLDKILILKEKTESVTCSLPIHWVEMGSSYEEHMLIGGNLNTRANEMVTDGWLHPLIDTLPVFKMAQDSGGLSR